VEVGERVVVDGDATGEPAEGIVMDAQIGEFARAGEARERGVQPQGDEQARIDGWTSGDTAASADAVIQEGEVRPLDVRPDGALGGALLGLLQGSHRLLLLPGPLLACSSFWGLSFHYTQRIFSQPPRSST